MHDLIDSRHAPQHTKRAHVLDKYIPIKIYINSHAPHAPRVVGRGLDEEDGAAGVALEGLHLDAPVVVVSTKIWVGGWALGCV